MRRVLVTGSSGRVGRAVVAALLDDSHVIGFDRVACPTVTPTEFVSGQLTDAVALFAAMQNVDCIVHLGAAPDDDPGLTDDYRTDDRDNFLSDLVPSNIVGTYHVLQSAKRAKVPRVILVSSGQVVDWHLVDEQSYVNDQTSLAPRYLYACTKVFLESIGRVYAKIHGLQILVARLGWCPRAGQEAAIQAEPLAPYIYLSGGDAGRFFAAAVRSTFWPQTMDADGKPFPFGIAYATSRGPEGKEMYDLSLARKLGYEPNPHDDWQTWLQGKRT